MNEHEKFTAHASSLSEDDLSKETEGNEEYVQIMLLDWNETEVLLVLLESFKEQTE